MMSFKIKITIIIIIIDTNGTLKSTEQDQYENIAGSV
jgi:hypothetical protein